MPDAPTLQRFRAVVLSAALLLSCPVDSSANDDGGRHSELQLIERNELYTVDGVSLKELREQLIARSAGAAADTWHGLARVTLDSQVELQPTADGCRLSRATLRAELLVWLPQWQPRMRVRQAVEHEIERRWKAMLAGLQRHEQGHRRQMLAAVRELWGRLVELPPRNDCAQLELDVHQQVERMKLLLRLRSDRYDMVTERGVRQGVAL